MTDETGTKDRRDFLSWVLMWIGTALGYGLGAVFFLKYLVPMGAKVRYREMYAGSLNELKVGESKKIRTPSGDTFLMARTSDGVRVLSDVCPHLGCRVHWQADTRTFYCPCHQGVFTDEGVAIKGPPADAGQRLARLETVIRGGAVYVMIKES